MAACTFVAVSALATLDLGAQQPAAPTFRGGVDVINVDVTVLDKNRRPVRGLTAADFTVLENGEPRPIVTFSDVDLPAPKPAPGATAPWLRTVASDVSSNEIAPDGRLVVILFDWAIRQVDLGAARRIASAAIDALGPHDLGGVVFSHGFKNGGTRQNFTSDKGTLLDAVSRPITGAAIDADGELLDMEETFGVVDTPSCMCGVCAYQKVADIADAVANIPGRRKTLLFISTSFPPPTPREPPPVPFGSDAPPQMGCTTEVVKARNLTTEKLALANLTIHVVDPSGGQALQTNVGTGFGYSTLPGASLLNTAFGRHADLPFLANLTGGRFVFEDNEPERVVPAIIDEIGSYYLLGFPAADVAKTRSGVHTIDVKVRGRDLTVQARSAYRPGRTAAADEAAARRATLVDALQATLPRTDQRLRIALAPFAAPDRRTATVAVVLRAEPPVAVDAASTGAASSPSTVAAAPAPRHDVITGVVLAFDSDGRVVASKKHAGQVPWAPGSSAPPPYELLTALDLGPGRYEIRAALDSAPDKRSSVYGFVDVPRFGEEPLTMSGIAVSVQPGAMSAPRGTFDAILPVVPTARRAFARSEIVTALVRLYHGRPSPPATSLTVRIVDAANRTVIEDRIADAPDEHQMPVPVDELDPGEYLLELLAQSGADRATRQLRFTVEKPQPEPGALLFSLLTPSARPATDGR
jgi:VWFA-related protein